MYSDNEIALGNHLAIFDMFACDYIKLPEDKLQEKEDLLAEQAALSKEFKQYRSAGHDLETALELFAPRMNELTEKAHTLKSAGTMKR